MTGWAIEALVASGVLMAVVLLVRVPVRRLFGPQLAYTLWALPLLRLLMPPLPASWREQVALPIARAGEVVTVLVGPDPAPATTAATAVEPAMSMPWATMPWGIIVAGVWLLGAAAFFALHFIRHRRFCRRLLADARVLDRIDGVRVIETPAASGPLAFGMARRFVAFPHDFADRYDADERELALAHELGHHARGDLIANWAALAVLAIHWFNPLAWHAFRAFRCDQELANDARVLAGRSRTDRHIYACAIVKAAHGGAISAACHLHTITDLKGRLRMLTNTRLSRTRLATGAAAIVGAITGGLLVTASGTQAAAALTERVESATGVQIAAPPVPPAPVVPPAPAVPATAARSTRQVVIVKDGKTTRYDGAAAAAYIAAHPVPVRPIPPVPAIPAITVDVPVTADVTAFTSDGRPTIVDSGNCQPATGAPTIVRKDRDGRRMTIVCRNRIEMIAISAQRQAEIGRRQAELAARHADLAIARADVSARAGLQQALASIRFARQTVENDRNLSSGERREALAGLDDAMKEVRQQLRD